MVFLALAYRAGISTGVPQTLQGSVLTPGAGVLSESLLSMDGGWGISAGVNALLTLQVMNHQIGAITKTFAPQVSIGVWAQMS